MKRIAALLVALLSLAPVAQAETLSYAPGTPLTENTLENGLTVLLLPLPNSPVTSVSLWVRAGSRDEIPGITGIAHLFEHMMFRPVAPGEPSYFDKAAKLGVDYNASTRFNATEFHDTFTPNLLPQVLAMEAHRFEHEQVSPAMLNVERKAVRSEYASKMGAQPMLDLWADIYRYAYGKHPYGWHIMGDPADLDRITADDCNRFFQKFYKPNNTLLAIAGPITPNTAISLVRQSFGDWSRGPARARWTNEPPMGTKPVEGPGKLTSPSKYVLIGYRAPDYTAPDHLAEDLAEDILFNGENALVAQRLMDQLHLASVADAFNTGYDVGLRKVLVLPNPGVDRTRIEREVQTAIDGFSKLPDADYHAYCEAYSTQLRESQLETLDVTSALGRAW
ncbi:MAG TPA: pitrilysin family protein, partial [Oscillatoriaceae cyanobacterium]